MYTEDLNLKSIKQLSTQPLSVLLSEAMRIRRKNFNNDILFATPGAKFYDNEYHVNNRYEFVNISVTGTHCSLRCDHCNGRLLETMLSACSPDELLIIAKKLLKHGCRGLLLSGGADKEGAVPLKKYYKVIQEMKAMGLKISVHCGLAKEKVLYNLKDAGVDQVLLDIIGDQKTIQEVYHLNKTPKDYANILEICKNISLEVAPHIVIGLYYGQTKGELEALRIISTYNPQKLVIVILTPMAKTKMSNINPPSVEECEQIIALARIFNPNAFLSLGCARPSGNTRSLIEQFSLNAGVNAIAYPSPETIGLAQEMGLKVSFRDWCCTFA